MKSIFVTVRTDSTRLPQKALLKINGVSTIELLIARLKLANNADNIILCTTDRQTDDILCEIASNNGILFSRGSTEDKLERWQTACEQYGVEFFVTADGDDLFCSIELIDQAFKQYEKNRTIDFIKADNIICGAFTYGIKAKALKKVCKIKNTSDTEMMWVYFTDTGLFNVAQLDGINKKYFRNDIRMTLDYKEDFAFFSEVVEQLKKIGKDFFDVLDIIELIDSNPKIAKINIHLQDEWKKNQQNKTKLMVKS